MNRIMQGGYIHLLVIFIISLIGVFLFSNDSLLYDITGHYDSAWFWHCGKWMIQGLIPYQDFADSKGPLFWLIYGLSYLITPTSHLGVCLFSLISYFISFLYSYKSMHFFLSKRNALIGSLLMIVFYWNPFFISETRAEHFTFPLVSICLYSLLRSLCNKGNSMDFLNGCILGGSIMAAFLIKWSIAVMFWGFGVAFLVIAIGNKKIQCLLAGAICGIALIGLPFYIYFEQVSSWNNFIDEYVFNVAKTVSRPLPETLWIYVKEWVKLFLSRRIIFVIMIVFVLLYQRKHSSIITSESKWLICVAAIGIISIGIHSDDFLMYLTPMAPFAIFLVLFFIESVWLIGKKRFTLGALLIVHAIWVIAFAHGKTLFCNNQLYRKDYFSAAYYIGQVQNPIMLNLGNETGIGTAVANVQPACKYWSFQRFCTEEMKQQQVDCLKSKKPDFITLQVWTDFVSRKEIEDAGYHWIAHFGYTDLFTKHQLKDKPEDIVISGWDVLLQRNVRKLLYEKI